MHFTQNLKCKINSFDHRESVLTIIGVSVSKALIALYCIFRRKSLKYKLFLILFRNQKLCQVIIFIKFLKLLSKILQIKMSYFK